MKLYCEYCKKYEDVRYEFSEKTYRVKDIDVTANIKSTFCLACNQDVYDREAEIQNDIIFFDAYKTQKGLLTSVEIKEIRNNYGIAQTTFSKILGLGEKTIARYETGSIQDKAQDNLIRLSSIEDNFLHLARLSSDNLSPTEKNKIKDYLELRFGVEFEYRYKPTSINSYQTIIEDEGENLWKTQQK